MLLTIIIPVYNEQNLIFPLLQKVFKANTSPYEKEVIVVDDGSTDGTGEILLKNPEGFSYRLLTHPQNRGKAASIKTALESATGEIILIQDADLEYSPSEYKTLIEQFSNPEVSAVYGSRFLKKAWPHKMKPHLWLANRFFTFTVNLLYGADITDEGTCYKAFRSQLLLSMDIESEGFEFCPEVTAKLLKRKVRIVEVPVSYSARAVKEGKKPSFKDGLRVLRAIVKYRRR